MSQFLFGYFIVVTLFTFVLYGIDKYKARHQRWRISETTLLLMAAIGGSVGALLGMRVFRHKTQHLKFKIGVPLILLLQLTLALWLLFKYNGWV